MNTEGKPIEQPIQEFKDLRQRIVELEKSEIERKWTEEALRESEERFKAQYLGNPTPTFTWQKKGEDFELIDFNHAARDITDGMVLEFLGKNARELYGNRQDILRDLQRCFDKQKIVRRVTSSENFMPGRLIAITMVFVPPDLVMVHLKDITERERAEEKLRESEENYRNLFENAHEAIYVAQDGKIVFLNPRTAMVFGYSGEELMSRPFIEVIYPDDRNMVVDRHVRRIKGEAVPQLYDFRIIHKDGNIRWVELNVVAINWKGKTATLNFLSDITNRKRVEEKLHDSEALWRLSIDNMLEAYALHEAIFDENGRMMDYRFLEFNPAAQKISNIARKDIIGRTAMELYPNIVERGLMNRYADVMATGVPAVIDDFYYAGDNLDKALDISCFRIDDHHFVCVFRDITDRKKAEEALKTMSFRDELTGLYNRRGFFTLAEQGLKTAQRMGTKLFLIFGDLDKLKETNDTLGHKEGDQALKDISQILKETFRESDIIARIGGDEFVILVMNSLETSDKKLIDRFKKGLNDHPLQTERACKLSMSFGISCFNPQKPCSIDVLLAQADKLMYENKQKKGR